MGRVSDMERGRGEEGRVRGGKGEGGRGERKCAINPALCLSIHPSPRCLPPPLPLSLLPSLPPSLSLYPSSPPSLPPLLSPPPSSPPSDVFGGSSLPGMGASSSVTLPPPPRSSSDAITLPPPSSKTWSTPQSAIPNKVVYIYMYSILCVFSNNQTAYMYMCVYTV